MLHGTALKVVIWCLTIVGLTPAVFLAFAALVFGLLRNPTAVISPDAPPELRTVALRDSFWFQIGPIRVEEWHPRVWAGVVLAVGIASIVIALIALLHVPRAA